VFPHSTKNKGILKCYSMKKEKKEVRFCMNQLKSQGQTSPPLSEQRKRSVPPTKEKPPPALFEASLPTPLLKDITPASSLAEFKRGQLLVNER